MQSDISYERDVLKSKRELICSEIDRKKANLEEAYVKYKNLSKESKGSYSEEKETSLKVYNVLSKDINNYQAVIDEPYFARVDFREHMSDEESIYIGKKGINCSSDGEEIVVDWRAPIADLYYSGTGGEAYYKSPSGIIEGNLNLKRKFLFKNSDISKIFDEGINEIIVNSEEGSSLVDEFLKINLEENTGKKLKEVVATIQKEQNEIIRWPKNIPLIVQGSAGSGKTTIALHRLAYLLYRYRDTMKGKDILVLAPNKLFLNYISDILPSLGAVEVNQSTFENLIVKKLKLKGKIYNKDEKITRIIEENDQSRKNLIIESSRIRGSLLFKTILERYIKLVEGSTLEIKDIAIDGEVLFDKKEIMRLYLKDMKCYPINKRKDEIKRYLNLKLKQKVQNILAIIDIRWSKDILLIKKSMEDSKDRREKLIEVYGKRDQIKKNIEKSAKKVFNEYFKSWRGIQSKDIYYNFYNDSTGFLIASDGTISDKLAQFMKEEYNKNLEKNIIDEDDLPSLAHIRNLLEGIEEKEKFSHIVVDEAQDYSPFQVFMVNELSKSNSLTLVGDLAQGIYHYKGLEKWEDVTNKLFDNNSTYKQLSKSYRSTVEIIDFAENVLKSQKLGLKTARPVLRHGRRPEVIYIDKIDEYLDVFESIIKEVQDLKKSTVAIITKDITETKLVQKLLNTKSSFKYTVVTGKEKKINENIAIIPSYLTKGLEFDCTIIFNPTAENYGDDILSKRLLYVALTRALHLEYIICNKNSTVTPLISSK